MTTPLPLSIASHASLLPAGDAPPDWVQLLPLGTVTGRDGRGPYRIGDQADAARIVEASRQGAPGGVLPMDFDHAIDLAAPRGEAAPASGWIAELEARADGIHGRVEWTPAAAQALRDRSYRFLSPVFEHRQDGTVTRLLRAGLTNNPNLTLTAIAAAQTAAKGREWPDKEGPMEELLKVLAAALGLPPDATREAALAQVATITAERTAAQAALTQVAAAAGVAVGTGTDGIVTAIAARQPDPSRFVPIELYTALAARQADAGQQAAEREATAAVDRLVAEGRATPAMRDHFIAMHRANPASFGDFARLLPVIVQPGVALAQQSPKDPGQLTEAEKQVCAKMGLSHEAFLKARTEGRESPRQEAKQ